MTRLPDDRQKEPPGGGAAARRKQFLEARGLTQSARTQRKPDPVRETPAESAISKDKPAKDDLP